MVLLNALLGCVNDRINEGVDSQMPALKRGSIYFFCIIVTNLGKLALHVISVVQKVKAKSLRG